MATDPTSLTNLPQPQSYQTILGNMLSSYASSLGINDQNVAAANVQFFQIVALMAARSSGDLFQILRDYSLDRATGPSLDRLGIEYGVPRNTARVTTGFVTVIDSTFQVISTTIYSGLNPPLAGSVTIAASDASSFPPTGSVIIGRGSPNVESAIAYTSITPVGSYFVFNLASPTQKYHNLNENIILSQKGVRTVPVNTIVVDPGIGSTPDIQFKNTQTAFILDGATTVNSVPITAQLPGASGNVPAGAITQFAGAPFAGATVTNPLPFTTGADTETDDKYRVRIKAKLASTGLGTVVAIESALQGVQSPDSSDTIVSTDVLNSSPNTIVYVDNGSGYEATHEGVGIESIVQAALGGEQFFQLVTGGKQTSVTKTMLQSVATSPFNLSGGEVLEVTIGNITYSHTFAPTDFQNPGSATAYEVTASLNADTSLAYEAVTAGGGTYVVIRPISETVDSMKVDTPSDPSVVDANSVLEFPSNLALTLRLYKNGVLLSEDGSTASIFTASQSLWSSTIASGDTLSMAVDGTQPITYTITDADFVAEGTYQTVSSSNSLESWANVFNNVITGITATPVGSTIEFTSNLGAIDRAQVTIVNTMSNPTSLLGKGMISLTDLTSTGVVSDYILDRNTAQIKLTVPLVKNDVLEAGTLITQANVKGLIVSTGSVTLASNAHVWILIDSPESIIPTIQSGSTITVTTASNIVTYTSSSSTSFSNVLPGDYVIIWSAELPATDRLEGRVHAATGSALSIKITSAEAALVTPVTNVLYVEGFVVCRTDNVPQKFKIVAGTSTLNVIAAELQAQSESLIFNVIDNNNIQVITNTDDPTGEITIVTADAGGQEVGFVSGVNSKSQDALIAFYETTASTSDFPLFLHSTVSADSYAEPIDTYLTTFNSTQPLSQFDPNEMIKFLNPYGAINDEQPLNESIQMWALSGGGDETVTILPKYPDVRRLRTNDRFFAANPLDFGYNDSIVSIVDNNTAGQTYAMPLYRRAITNTSYPVNNFSFNAYDVDAGSTAQFSTNFSGFDFSNFKAYLQAKNVLKGSNPQTALLYRSTQWGESGEVVNVAYTYPTSANQPISSIVTVSNTASIRISLASGTPITTTLDASTQWNVTVTANTPSAGIDQATYTYNGTGTPPGLTLSGGEYVTILPTTGFNKANTGTFRVSTVVGFTPTSVSFSVQTPTGTAVPQSNVPTTTVNGLYFYNSTPTTAAQINTYVNSNLSQYVTTTIVNDGGSTGSGIIVLSTFEDSGFTAQSVFLMDGINWIATSNIGGSPEFTFKEPLTLDSSTGYSFNAGDEVRLVPTTMDQVQRFWSVLAVTGFTTVGTVETVDRGTKLQLATETLGSVGAVQIVGGSGNGYSVPILTSGEVINPTTMIVSANTIASQAVTSEQWFRLSALNFQNKNTGIAANTSVTVANNTPIAGQSTVTLLNRTITQRYFGASRVISGLSGLTFRVEPQGTLVCFSYTGSTTSPQFLTFPIVFGSTTGDTFSVTLVPGTSDSKYTILTGTTTFSNVTIGDQVTFNISSSPANSGTFTVTGVSASVLQLTNPNAVALGSTSVTSGTTFTGSTGVMEGDTVTVTGPFSPTNRGAFRVIRTYNDSFWIENPNAIEEEQVLTSTSLVFHPYDASVPGDKLFVNGSVLGLGNSGTYPIVSVTSPTVAVVTGNISSQTSTNIASSPNSLNVVEGKAYTGYKQVSFVAANPGSTTFNNIAFNTIAQYDKISASANIGMASLSKLSFPVSIKTGIDSYNYDTGLIGEANRVIYGDPRDQITYSGVNAAGTDIFIREPLLFRVKVALAIRTNIGVSFSQITQQIQSSVYSLILSNPLGVDLDLSSIVETVRAIPGVTSVVLTNPAYDLQNDEIKLVTGQKAFVVQLSDISVSLLT